MSIWIVQHFFTTRLNAILDLRHHLRSLVGHDHPSRFPGRLLLWLVACSEALWRLTHLTSKQDWVKTNQIFIKYFFLENVQKTYGEITSMCRGESCKLSLQSVL